MPWTRPSQRSWKGGSSASGPSGPTTGPKPCIPPMSETASTGHSLAQRREPRCTLFVFSSGAFEWLALETTVTILDGLDAPAQNLRLFRDMQSKPSGKLSWFGGELDDEAFLRAMVDERRLIYEFDVQRTYGLF